jgi:glycosyltransferase involved in cell wall biosynthesis
MNRMWSEIVKQRPGTRVVLVYRDRGVDTAPAWADAVVPALRSRGFGRIDQLRWILRAAVCVVRHRRSVDVVHLQGAYLTNLLPALFARRGSVVMLPVLENGDLGAMPHSAIKRWIVRRIGAHARAGFALSDGIADELVRTGLDADRIRRLSNPVDPRMISEDPAVRPPHHPVRLGFIGKLGPLKNPHLLLEAAAALRTRGTPCEVHFFGPFASPAMEARLRGRTADLDLEDDVHFHGFQSDILPSFDRFDIFVLPSAQEGLPGSLMEAFAMGKPVIVTDVGSMAEYVRRAGAGRIVRADADEIAEAVLRILDADSWTAAARNARSFAAEQLDPRVVADHYVRQIERKAR